MLQQLARKYEDRLHFIKSLHYQKKTCSSTLYFSELQLDLQGKHFFKKPCYFC